MNEGRGFNWWLRHQRRVAAAGKFFFSAEFIDEIDWQFRLLHLVPVPSTSIIKIGRPLLHSTGAR